MLCNDDLQRMIDAINYLNKKEKKNLVYNKELNLLEIQN
jgi:hypothetical protein